MDSITITIRESAERTGRFEVFHDGKHLCTSRTPLLSAARKLIAQGADPAATLTMWRDGSTSWDMRAPLGAAAALMVADKHKASPHFVAMGTLPSQQDADLKDGESYTLEPLVSRSDRAGITAASSL